MKNKTILIVVTLMMCATQIMADESTYLHFTAIESQSTIKLSQSGTPQSINLTYSIDSCTTWNRYTIGNRITLEKGEKVYLKADRINNTFGAFGNNYHYFEITGGSVSADGNIMSIIDSSMQRTWVEPYSFSNLFKDCYLLVKAPELPATELYESCYAGMFSGCSSLTEAPELPATTMHINCYSGMFRGCSSLTKAPELPATILQDRCYEAMFSGCSSLREAPELPATKLLERCYGYMFTGCTSLTQAPDLPSQVLAKECYRGMFSGCTSLVIPPALPALIAVDYCYASMFQDCASLIQLPKLPATSLGEKCYFWMFADCESLRINENPPGARWSIPSNARPSTTEASDDWNQEMFLGTGGSFTGWPGAGITYYVASDTTVTDLEITVASDNEIIVGPNPAGVDETVCVKVDDCKGSMVEVVTLEGTLVRQIEAKSNIVEIEALKVSGIYVVKVVDKNGRIKIQKLVVR